MPAQEQVLASQHAFVFTLKRMPCSKQVGNASGRAPYCIVTRWLHFFTSDVTSWTKKLPRSCPCLTCSIKITQVGISEVVYAQGYGMDAQVNERDPSSSIKSLTKSDGRSFHGGRREASTILSSERSSSKHQSKLTVLEKPRRGLVRLD